MGNYTEFNRDAVDSRIAKMVAIRKSLDVTGLHVKFSKHNSKTGSLVTSVSLIPVADCGNCLVCRCGCYDVRNVCFHQTVQMTRAINSAIYMREPERYFKEVEEYVGGVSYFRWHIGGDIRDHLYFRNMVGIARRNPHCQFLAFTKMYPAVNMWIEFEGDLPDNLHIIFSDWPGVKWFDNPYNLPVSSPLWSDGTTGPHCTKSVHLCKGDCSSCAKTNEGCWVADKGDTILFEAH